MKTLVKTRGSRPLYPHVVLALPVLLVMSWALRGGEKEDAPRDIRITCANSSESVEISDFSLRYRHHSDAFDDPRSDTPAKLTSIDQKAAVSPEAVKRLLALIESAGFFDLKGEYGGAANRRYYGHTITVKVGAREKKVIYRSRPDAEPAPEGFAKVERRILDFAKEAVRKDDRAKVTQSDREQAQKAIDRIRAWLEIAPPQEGQKLATPDDLSAQVRHLLAVLPRLEKSNKVRIQAVALARKWARVADLVRSPDPGPGYHRQVRSRLHFAWDVLLAAGELREGMKVEEAVAILGPPAQATSANILWYYQSPMHVNPSLQASLEDGRLKKFVRTMR